MVKLKQFSAKKKPAVEGLSPFLVNDVSDTLLLMICEELSTGQSDLLRRCRAGDLLTPTLPQAR